MKGFVEVSPAVLEELCVEAQKAIVKELSVKLAAIKAEEDARPKRWYDFLIGKDPELTEEFYAEAAHQTRMERAITLKSACTADKVFVNMSDYEWVKNWAAMGRAGRTLTK